MIIRNVILVFMPTILVALEVAACTTPKIVEMGVIKERDIDNQPIYLEKLYDASGMLCGEAEVVKEYKRDKSITRFALVKYFDENGQVKLRENYEYLRGKGYESIDVSARHKDGRASWTLTMSTIPELNKEETLIENPKPNLGYLKWFVSNTAFERDALKQHALQR